MVVTLQPSVLFYAANRIMAQLIQKTWTTRKEIVIENEALLIKTKNIREDISTK